MDLGRDNILDKQLVKELEESYLNYSMSVIMSRALPDARDGLKPVHRRILFSMSEMSAMWNRPYKKSARVVGEVLGKYHPHGDSSIYDAMVRMAQEFSMRHELVQGQGNFGSIDGDRAAAMRYTESRMSKIGSELLRDIDKETIPWTTNFDETLKEPAVLPAVYPNLLVNGSEGIAVGMATKIPPHNLSELVDGLVELMSNPEAEVKDLMRHIKGPDFPTFGKALGVQGIIDAYETGRGKVIMQGRAHVEPASKGRDSLIITELPYQVNKANLIEKIAYLARDKKIEGIAELRDESDKDGMRVVIEIKRDAVPEVVLNQLYKQTQLQDTFGIILLALVDGTPKVMNLKEILEVFIAFRLDVVVKRTKFDLAKAEARAHILEGLKIALKNIDKIVETIKKSKDPVSAKEALMEGFGLSEKQSQAILDMRLQRLTGLETDKIISEYKDIIQHISELKGILESKSKRMEIIKEELLEVKEKYGEERRTEIIKDFTTLSIEDMIAEEEMVLTITHNGYIKRTSLSTYRSQRRGGRGVQGASSRDEDFVEHLFVANTHSYILFFTDKGKCYWVKVYDIPEGGRAAKGRAIVNLIGCEADEKVSAFISVKEFNEDHFVVMATEKGIVKKTKLSAYSNPRKKGIYAVEIRDGDRLIEARVSTGDNDILLGTRNGKSIRFSEEQIRPSGRKTMGVKGITLNSEDDRLVGMLLIKREGTTVLVATEKGFGKRTEISQYRAQKRGGKGVLTMKTTEKVGKMVTIKEVVDKDDLMIITNQGVLIRQPVAQIRAIGRATQGVKLIKLGEGTLVSSITRIMTEEEGGEEKTQEEVNDENSNPKTEEATS
jgi:DNA gyrase subunit A